MKPTILVVLGALLVPAVAAAQPAYAPPPPPPGYAMPPGPALAPGGFHDRAGRLALGFSFGIGKLKVDDNDVACNGCDGDPPAFSFDAHIGWMSSPRLALMFEVQGNGQAINQNEEFTDTLMQSTETIGAQYWLTPQLWLKGGIGAAQLTVSRDDGFSNAQSDSIDGVALTGAVGYEIMSARNFAIDLQLRATGGTYKDAEDLDGSTSDINVGTTSLGLGFNWY